MDASVSVALCTHNGARFLGAQVESILAQTMPVSEIVLGDDASDDASIEIVTALASKAGMPLRVLRASTPFGVVKNFERTITACTGEFVALADQDDVWHPDRVERALAQFERQPHLSLVSGNAVLADAEGAALRGTLFDALGVSTNDLAAIERGNAFDVLMRRNIVTGATTMLRRSLADLASPFPDSWVHDEWLAIVAAARGEVAICRDPLIDYRQHGQNQIGVTSLSLVGKTRRMLEPGAARNLRLHSRATALADRIGTIPDVTSDRVAAAREKVRHEEVRSTLSAHRIQRLRAVFSELRTGRYGRFGRGVSDAVRDILQPLTNVPS